MYGGGRFVLFNDAWAEVPRDQEEVTRSLDGVILQRPTLEPWMKVLGSIPSLINAVGDALRPGIV